VTRFDAIVIAGPTAAGKTTLVLALAEILPCEIINMDSVLVYRGMDIGTAKPSPQQLTQVPHHLIDIIEPEQSYSAADFVRDVERLIPEIRARGRLPIVVGGTMLYLHSWLTGLSVLPPADEGVRAQLQQAWQENPQALHDRLLKLDPVAGARIHPNDPQRILRALEVIELTGKSLTEQQQQRQPTQLKLARVLMQAPSRDWLQDRIVLRFDQMLAAGLLAEVKGLMARASLSADCPSMRSVGYRQAWQFLSGEISYHAMREQAIIATRGLAKRQQTWMKKITSDLELMADQPLSEQLTLIKALLAQ
jgi:tRNA dimethylallyltransferase